MTILPKVVAVLMLVAGSAVVATAEDSGPNPPDSPLRALVGQLAAKRPARPTTGTPPAKEDLLLREFRFKPAKTWLLLPDLANGLGTTDEERAAVLQLLDVGTREAKKLLAAEGADNDVAAATALFMSQLWQFARGTEIPEAHVDALHAQIVSVFKGDEVAKMSDADKQRYWEFCLGYPIFIAGMAEVIEGDEQKEALRQAAAVGFETLIGVNPALVDIGPGGLTIRAGVEEAAAELAREAEAKERAPEAGPAAGRATAASREKLPASGPAISGITYTAPPGWTRETVDGNTLFRATLGDVEDDGRPASYNNASHQATIGVLPVLSASRGGPSALFEKTWREQFAPFELGDTVVHYRGRLPSQLVVLYMGRFFQRPNTPRQTGNPQTYGALWLVDLGDNRFQPLIALVEPRDESLGMDQFKESAALKALSFPLGKFLDSVKPAKGAPPYPAGGYFAASDLRGTWAQSSSAFGGFYANAQTGAYAGAAVTASGGHFALNDDGTYAYDFGYYSYNPQFGNQSGSTKHSGRYTLNGDIVLVQPSKPLNYSFTCCAVGVGTRQTQAGVKRILVTVSANNSGEFHQPPLIPNWDSYRGTMTWYMEE